MTEDPRIIVVAHGVDTDGIISHVLLERAHEGREIEHHYVDCPDLPETLERLAEGEPENAILYVADMNLSLGVLTEAEIDPTLLPGPGILPRLKDRYAELAWFDHHSGSAKHQDVLSEHATRMCIDTERCTSEIIFGKLLGKSDHQASYLAKAARAHDFGLEGPHLKVGEDIQAVVTCRSIIPEDPKEALDEFVHDLATGKAAKAGFGFELRDKYQEDVRRFASMRDNAIARLDTSVDTYHLPGGRKAIVGYANPWLYMKTGPNHLRAAFPDADLHVVIFSRDTHDVIISSNDPKWGQCVPGLCESLGGGGRSNPTADGGKFYKGGFRLKGNANVVISEIKDYLERN